MPNTPPKPKRQQPRFDPNRGDTPPEMIELVDPAWILKALGAMLALGAVCGYITLCIVFAHTQWQLVLHPSRTVAATPASLNLPFHDVRFGPDVSGEPQLSGWIIPSSDQASTADAAPTAILLHGATGSMADALPAAQSLHNAGLNVLLFDYRGFGLSAGQHPTQALMQQDALSALDFLTGIHHTPPSKIVVFGAGLGASLAVKLCADHPNLPALILDTPDGDLATVAAADIRSHIIPISLLFNQDFPLADALHTLHTQKLLITHTNGPAPEVIQRAADPKMTVELPPGASPISSLTRFLDSIFPTTPPTLKP